jgi:RNA polymerase sigma factor (sigma-70 family)
LREIPFDPEAFEDPWMFDEIPGLGSDGLEWVLSERIKDAVEDLPEDERAVVEMLFWGQSTKVEVAEALGRSRQSVHDLLRRALVSLRSALRDLEEAA